MVNQKILNKVYSLIVFDFQTPKQISQRLKIKIGTVYNYITELRKQGKINKDYVSQKPQGCTPKSSLLEEQKNLIRLHAENYSIKVITKSIFYEQQLQKCNAILLDGHNVRLYPKSIIIFSGISFYGTSTADCDRQSTEYWRRFLLKLEKKLHVILIKPYVLNVKRTRAHYAETHNELAEELNKKKEKLYLKGDDGKLWLVVDNSYHLNELECVHPTRSAEDMNLVRNHFQDMRQNPSLPMSELTKLSETLTNYMVTISKSQSELAQILTKLINPEEISEPQEEKPQKVIYIG